MSGFCESGVEDEACFGMRLETGYVVSFGFHFMPFFHSFCHLSVLDLISSYFCLRFLMDSRLSLPTLFCLCWLFV